VLSKIFSHIPTARRANEIDVGKNYVNRHAGFTEFDGLFAARGLDNDVTCFLQAGGNIVPDEELILDKENDPGMGTVCR